MSVRKYLCCCFKTEGRKSVQQDDTGDACAHSACCAKPEDGTVASNSQSPVSTVAETQKRMSLAVDKRVPSLQEQSVISDLLTLRQSLLNMASSSRDTSVSTVSDAAGSKASEAVLCELVTSTPAATSAQPRESLHVTLSSRMSGGDSILPKDNLPKHESSILDAEAVVQKHSIFVPFPTDTAQETTNQAPDVGNKIQESSNQGKDMGNKTEETSNQGEDMGNKTEETSNQAGNMGNKTEETSNQGGGIGNKTEETSNQGGDMGNKTEDTSNQGGDMGNKTEETSNQGGGMGSKTEETSNQSGDMASKIQVISSEDEHIGNRMPQVPFKDGDMGSQIQETPIEGGNMRGKTREIFIEDRDMGNKLEAAFVETRDMRNGIHETVAEVAHKIQETSSEHTGIGDKTQEIITQSAELQQTITRGVSSSDEDILQEAERSTSFSIESDRDSCVESLAIEFADNLIEDKAFQVLRMRQAEMKMPDKTFLDILGAQLDETCSGPLYSELIALLLSFIAESQDKSLESLNPTQLLQAKALASRIAVEAFMAAKNKLAS
eukprot:Gregarina_sp_Poly_1__567@NODE_1135_length_4981_cov_83_856532_g784_i0_p1_GENE_NODE_1135_length_4981_cov_83_856532_g784_i0NODE_1135_length_4981_cov_83_856532_g784_i0_p1_ORF_typecomplete_len551_score129_15Laminin_I/PF06008_14/0_64Laminin_I/PF06008_14/21Laminin_I/PF06008_14/8_6Laminin_I/PF06008_14/37GluR_Homerbdg/PF10606_9/1_8e03GluR_Homerbdg/PF10606_9/4_5GluR_Homerbdg/PF10606_9/8_6e02MCPsignal/PF00015_21/2_6e03MCPsignal/PF00015_21/0_67MCPsignal/PF00015_21/4_4MCPsignal/PF00015_21/3_3_NODE_1135_lengt